MIIIMIIIIIIIIIRSSSSSSSSSSSLYCTLSLYNIFTIRISCRSRSTCKASYKSFWHWRHAWQYYIKIKIN